MAVCPICRGEMLDEISCSPDPLIIDGELYEPVRWGDERRYRRYWIEIHDSACTDCGTPSQGIHHHGCDIEECPACHAQAISCACQEPLECDYVKRRKACALRVRPAIRARRARPRAP